jgi:hypothetical protein
MGQTRPLGDVGSISGLPPKAAVQRTLVDGSNVPLPDSRTAAKNAFYSISSSARATSIGGERERELIDRLAPPAPYGCLRFQVFRPVFGPELSSLPPSLLPLLLGEVGWRRGASSNRITNSHEEFFLSRRRRGRITVLRGACATGEICILSGPYFKKIGNTYYRRRWDKAEMPDR